MPQTLINHSLIFNGCFRLCQIDGLVKNRQSFSFYFKNGEMPKISRHTARIYTKKITIPSEKLAKSLQVRRNLNFSNVLIPKWNLSKDLNMHTL